MTEIPYSDELVINGVKKVETGKLPHIEPVQYFTFSRYPELVEFANVFQYDTQRCRSLCYDHHIMKTCNCSMQLLNEGFTDITMQACSPYEDAKDLTCIDGLSQDSNIHDACSAACKPECKKNVYEVPFEAKSKQ